MQLLADESTPFNLVQHIRGLEVEISTAKEMGLSGKPDEEILSFAIKNKLTLITADIEFGNILLYPPASHLGVVVLRYSPRVTPELLQIVSDFVEKYKATDLFRTLVIIDKNKYRVRKY